MATRDLLFEIGTEELPSGPLNNALTQLEALVPATFEQARLTWDSIAVYATPRRIAIAVTGLCETQPDRSDRYKGPAAAVAFKDGEPTPALIGFARGKGVELSDIKREDVDGVEYVFAEVHTAGQSTNLVLPELLETILTGIDWKRSQRWGSGSVRFVRPVRWLLALFGRDVVPVSFGDLSASNITYGHRFLSPKPVEITALREYQNILKGNFVVVDQAERKRRIVEDINEVAQPFGTPLIDQGVLAEVVNLVEFPTAVVGQFEETFLRVPREILEYAMSKHQRYFAIQRVDGTLDNHFVVISNGDPAYAQQIVEGHERVVRARLADAAFFYDEDRKHNLEFWLDKLGSVVFQEKLGTSLAKVERIERLVERLAHGLKVQSEDQAYGLRAARLAKADLTTNAVVEFTNLQGVMGSYYALNSGEDEQVAVAIKEHYQPRFAGDAIPSTVAGQLVSIADKMDTIAGIFAIGMAPKGTSDPFALRRSAIGIIQIALQSLPLSLSALIDDALDGVALAVAFDRAAVHQQISDFFATRLETILKDAGYSYDTVAAVLAVAGDNPSDARDRCAALESFKSQDDMINLSIAFGRAKNLAVAEAGTDVDESLLGNFDRSFFEGLSTLAQSEAELLPARRYEELLAQFASLRTVVDEFFDNVMVMDPDPAIKQNRLALLNTFVELVMKFADIGLLA